MKEIRALTGLRGIAALVVFWGHSYESLRVHGLSSEMPLAIQRLFLSGTRQVDIFFVLSGFILALIYRDWFTRGMTQATYWEFLRRRLARIWPLHAFILMMVLAMVLIAQTLSLATRGGLDRFVLADLPDHLILVHAWGPFTEDGGAWNPPSWSISIETIGYMVFPVMLWLTVRARSSPLLLLALATCIGFGLNSFIPWGLDGVRGVARGLSEFFFGCVLAKLFVGPVAAWLQGRVGSLLSVALLVGGFLLVAKAGFIIAVLVAPLMLALCGDNAPARLLGSKPLHFLGEVSFSIYLGHFLYMSILNRVIKPEWMLGGTGQMVVGLLLMNVIVVALSTLTYRYIEQPGRAWLSGRSKPSGTGGTPPTVPASVPAVSKAG